MKQQTLAEVKTLGLEEILELKPVTVSHNDELYHTQNHLISKTDILTLIE